MERAGGASSGWRRGCAATELVQVGSGSGGGVHLGLMERACGATEGK
jgi:hypothetical protein